jgi:hypothetical protein
MDLDSLRGGAGKNKMKLRELAFMSNEGLIAPTRPCLSLWWLQSNQIQLATLIDLDNTI